MHNNSPNVKVWYLFAVAMIPETVVQERLKQVSGYFGPQLSLFAAELSQSTDKYQNDISTEYYEIKS